MNYEVIVLANGNSRPPLFPACWTGRGIQDRSDQTQYDTSLPFHIDTSIYISR
jgi:hypothetical protein